VISFEDDPILDHSFQQITQSASDYSIPQPAEGLSHISEASVSNPANQLLCSTCGNVFYSIDELNSHNLEHSHPRVCNFKGCDRRFKLSTDRIRHRQETHNVNPRQYYCKHRGCKYSRETGRFMKRREHMDEHIRRRHGNRA